MELNINNRCFICLRFSNFLKKKESLNCEESGQVGTLSLRNIFKLLNVNVEETAPPIKLVNDEQCDSDVNVSLCEDCMKVGSKLSDLYLKLEAFYLEVDYYVRELQKQMSKCYGDAPKLLQNQQSIRLRKQLAEKCSSNRFGSLMKCMKKAMPEAEVSEIAIQPEEVKIENVLGSEEDFEDEAEINVPVSPVDSKELHSTAHEDDPVSKEDKGLSRRGSTGSGKYKCSLCDKKYHHFGDVRRHYKNVHLQKQNKCEGRSRRTFSYLSTSLLAEKAICNGPKKKLARKQRFMELVGKGEHSKGQKDPVSKDAVAEGNEPKYKCKACDKRYHFPSDVRRHFRIAHLQERYVCEKCGVSLTTKPTLKNHLVKCDGVRFQAKMVKRQSYKFDCDICLKKFSSKANLMSHHKAVHLNLRCFPCKLCDKTFKHCYSLKSHQNKVHFNISSENSGRLKAVKEENLVSEGEETEENEIESVT